MNEIKIIHDFASTINFKNIYLAIGDKIKFIEKYTKLLGGIIYNKITFSGASLSSYKTVLYILTVLKLFPVQII